MTAAQRTPPSRQRQPDRPGITCSPALPVEAGDSTHTITSGGIERTYSVHVPQGYDGSTGTAVVVVFHGLGQTADFVREMSGLDAAADAGGVIVVYPGGTGAEPAWNIGQFAGGPDDVAFTNELLDALTALFVDGKLVPNTELGHIEIRGKDAEARASDAARQRKDMSWEEWGGEV